MSLCGLVQFFECEPLLGEAIRDCAPTLEGGPPECPVVHPIPRESAIPIVVKAGDTHVTMGGGHPSGEIKLTFG